MNQRLFQACLWVCLALTAVACRPRVGPTEIETEDFKIDAGPGGDEDGANARRPKVCVSGNFVYAVWVDDRTVDHRIRMNRSLDGGVTWMDGDILVSADTPPGFQTGKPAIACQQGRVAIAWEDQRDGPLGNPGIYVNVSQDAGGNWLGEAIRVTLDEDGDWRSLEPQIALFGTDVYLVWYDGREGAFDIYFNRGINFGATWLPEEVRLDTDDPGAAYSARPRMVATPDGKVLVVWVDSRWGSNDVYFNMSLDHGMPGTWMEQDLRLDDDLCDEAGTNCQASDSFAAEIALRDGVAVVAWHERSIEDGDSRADIYTNVATDLEALDFFVDPVRIDTDGPQLNASQFPQVGILDSGRIAVAWRDARNGGFDILASYSDDLGTTWLEEEVRLDSDPPGTGHSTDPVLAVGSDGQMAVVWSDQRNSTELEPWEDLYFAASTDGGECWFKDQRVDDDPPGTARSVFPWADTFFDAGEQRTVVRVLWEEWRFGNADVYYRSMPLEGEDPHCVGEEPESR
jgi:hypothetical protein